MDVVAQLYECFRYGLDLQNSASNLDNLVIEQRDIVLGGELNILPYIAHHGFSPPEAAQLNYHG